MAKGMYGNEKSKLLMLISPCFTQNYIVIYQVREYSSVCDGISITYDKKQFRVFL